MNADFFAGQIQRLCTRFGARHFDDEFKSLCWDVVFMMPEQDFTAAVSLMIANRPVTKPPLVPDFRDAWSSWDKSTTQRAVNGAVKAMAEPAQFGTGKARHLALNYPGAKSLTDAVNQQIELNRLSRQVKAADEGAA